MAAFNLHNTANQFRGFSQLNAVRQVGLMVGLAASVAIGVAIVLWAQSPSYSFLYGGLTPEDRAAVVNALGQAGIEYTLDAGSGAVMVPAADVYNARIRLATEGLPKGTQDSFDLLLGDQGFGTSRFVEKARYNRMIETELARSIASLGSVASARVHLARPEQSVFVRPSQQPSASVVLDLHAGATLDAAQVAGIVHLVAASVPGLQPDHVTVVDHNGDLLTRRDRGSPFGVTSQQFKLTRRLEQEYQERVIDLLAPIVGAGGVRAQVAATLDYTRVETTREIYDPEGTALRSEQVSKQMTRDAETGGVPGALTNQPPPAGQAVPVTGQPVGQGLAEEASPVSSSSDAIRNYELNRTVSHIQETPGSIRRLSVAVVVDNKTVVNDKGEATPVTRTAEEMARITTLVKQAVGFNAERGDSVDVINAPFQAVAPPPPMPAPPIWQQPWVQTVFKQLLGALGIALLLFGVLRPALKSLASRGPALATSAGPMPADELTDDSRDPALPARGQQQRLTAGQDGSERPRSIHHAEQLATVKSMAKEDPKRVAQVVKTWLSSDE